MRNWIGRTAAKHSARLTAISRIPVLGSCVRYFGRLVISKRSLLWMQIQAGAGKGLWMELNPRTAEMFVQGSAEQPVQEFILQHLKPGMVFYDLGANCGYFSLIASRIVGNSGYVYSFEPEHENAERVRANLKRNGFEAFTVIEAAVWRETGTVSFVSSDADTVPDRGTGKVSNTGGGQEAQIPALALDDFVKEARPPDLIKCDIEGAEAEAFRGAAKIITDYRPRIVCEVHSAEIGRVLRPYLTDFGYSIHDLDENHICAEPERK